MMTDEDVAKTIVATFTQIDEATQERIRAAVAEEREACAVIADDMMPSNHNPPPHAAGREYAAVHIAAAIRARP